MREEGTDPGAPDRTGYCCATSDRSNKRATRNSVILALLLSAYAVSMYTLWVWRLTVDLSPGDVAFMAVAFAFSTGLGSLIEGARSRSVSAGLLLFGTIYVCALVATRGYPARMLDFRGRPLVGTVKGSQTSWNQLIFLGLLIPAGLAIILFGHRL
jgi:hypothetical protein